MTTPDPLQELRSVGRVDSFGRFTLDPQVARQKLRRYRYQNRHEYILALLSAAVRIGATRFDVQFRPGLTLVAFDGEFTQTELEGLFDPRAPLAVQDLAAGLLEADEVELDSGPLRLTRTALSPSPAPCAGTRLRLPQAMDLNRSLRATFGRLPEHRLLAERGAFAPLTVSADLQPLNRPLDLGDVFVRSSDSRLGLGHRPEHGGVRLLVAGVTYPFPHLHKTWPELRGLVDAPRLRLDASRNGVVQDEDFQDLLQQVQEQAGELLQQAARRRAELRTRDLRAAVAMARRRTPAQGPVLELLLESLETRTRPYDSGRLDLTLRAVDSLRAEGRDDEADERLRVLGADLRTGVLQAWRDSAPADASQALAALHRVEGPPWDCLVAECRSALGDDVSAENLWRDVLARQPHHPAAVEGLALCMRRRGRPGHPLPHDGSPRSAWLQANTALARGHVREAARHYREALVPGPWGLLAWDGLAEALFLMGLPDRAMEVLAQSLQVRNWQWPLLTRPAQGSDGLLCALLSTGGAWHVPRNSASALASGVRMLGYLLGSGLLIRLDDLETSAHAAAALENLHHGDDGDALRDWRRALTRAEAVYPLVHPVREYLSWRLVHHLRRMRRFEEADVHWARCDAIARWRWDLPAEVRRAAGA